MDVWLCNPIGSWLFDKLRDPVLTGLDEQKIDSILKQFLDGPVVLGGKHFELPGDLGMELRTDIPLPTRAGRKNFSPPPLRRDNQCRVLAEKEIADCRAPAVSDPALRQMVRPIVQHVTALTERAQIL
jgi:hypothetical protein